MVSSLALSNVQRSDALFEIAVMMMCWLEDENARSSLASTDKCCVQESVNNFNISLEID